jgi:hypothetical protein
MPPIFRYGGIKIQKQQIPPRHPVINSKNDSETKQFAHVITTNNSIHKLVQQNEEQN